MISPFRFFTIAPLHSRYMLLALAAVLASGLVMLIVDPAKSPQALAPLALLQMLAASSGFAVAARRGHLDLLLTAGPTRVNIALVHLGLSILPGMVVWWVLGVIEMLVGRTVDPLAFTSGTMVSLAVISTLSWALSVRLPRLSGGIAWLLGIAMWIVGWSDGAVLSSRSVLVVTLCPFVLLGRRLSGADALRALPAVALAVLFTVIAVVWIVRMDVPLESAQ